MIRLQRFVAFAMVVEETNKVAPPCSEAGHRVRVQALARIVETPGDQTPPASDGQCGARGMAKRLTSGSHMSAPHSNWAGDQVTRPRPEDSGPGAGRSFLSFFFLFSVFLLLLF
jgi:hypothetical protein